MSEFIENFKNALGREYFEGKEITGSTILSELPIWDSLAVVAVVAMLDLEYEKRSFAAEITKCKTLNDLYKISVS